MAKLDKQVVLYYRAKDVGEKEGSHCSKCMMFWDGNCTVLAGSINGEKGVCGLYVHGKHSGPNMHGELPKGIAGYTEEGPTQCGNCRNYGGGNQASGPCKVVYGEVEYRGCCNHWQSQE